METKTITTADESFTVPQPYAEGHTLTANEASALNQVMAENLRNNFASKVKEAKESGAFDLAALQAQLDEYAEDYEFGARGGGGGPRDPVKAEAMNIAKEVVRNAIRKKGIKIADVPAKKITELANDYLSKNPQVMEEARARVEATRNAASDALDDVLAGL